MVVSGSPDISEVMFLPICGWWCPALWMPVFTCLPSNLSTCLVGGVQLFGCLSSVVSLNLSSSLAGSVRLSGCLSSLVICFPVWLVMSGSSIVTKASLLAGVGFALAMYCRETGCSSHDFHAELVSGSPGCK